MKNEMKSEVLGLTWNRLEYTQETLEHHLKFNQNHPHIFVVADNGSTDGTREWIQSKEKQWIKQYPKIEFKFRYYKKNYGKHRVLNHFFRLADPNTIFVGMFCDDTLVPKDWIYILEGALHEFPEVGILGADDGRDWGEANLHVRNGHTVSIGDAFFWNDNCYLLRVETLNAIGKIKRSVRSAEPGPSKGCNVYSKYFIENSWSLTDSSFYSGGIRNSGYKLGVCTKALKVDMIKRLNTIKQKKHSILVQRIFCLDVEKYWKATEGVLTWTEKGSVYTFSDEPEIERRALSLPVTANIPKCQLDDGVIETDIQLLTQEERDRGVVEVRKDEEDV